MKKLFLILGLCLFVSSCGAAKSHLTCKVGGAIDACARLAKQGNAQAQYSLGFMYAFGYSVPKDKVKGVYWITKAAKQGVARAQYNLGLMYDQGNGVPKDQVKAVYWYTKAAKQGNAYAQSMLGSMHLRSRHDEE